MMVRSLLLASTNDRSDRDDFYSRKIALLLMHHFLEEPIMDRLFRKYHRLLAIMCALPLLLTVLTGIMSPIANAVHQYELSTFLIRLHTLEILGLDVFFPVINGLGLLGLLITGIYMTRIFRKQRPSSTSIEP